ncbi:hypothetical protein J9303_20080 [Bacillaceae bacterium Marseille-Q3522]|nr:hypothetical protein [Bacillaceae bacterium Marseille-Q3522]
MEKVLSKSTYNRLQLSKETLEKLSVKPEVEDGKTLLDRKNKDHSYLFED